MLPSHGQPFLYIQIKNRSNYKPAKKKVAQSTPAQAPGPTVLSLNPELGLSL